MKKITIIGGGNLGSALAFGLSAGDDYGVTVTGRKEDQLGKFKEAGMRISTDNEEAVRGADAVVFCLQPTVILSVMEKLSGTLSEEQLLVSTATGVSLEEMVSVLGSGRKVVRAMPNTASAIRQSMTCITGSGASEEDMSFTRAIFSSIGEVLEIEEELMQAATVLGASGVAFFLRYIRAATQGGIQMGFHPSEAKAIAVQTALGAAGLVNERGLHPEEEIDKVTTPRGCTIEGLNEMEHRGLSSAVIKGLMASYHKISSIR